MSGDPVLDFIGQDIAKAASKGRAAAAGLFLVLATVATALAWRDDYVGVWRLQYLTPTVIMLTFLLAFPDLYRRGGKRSAWKLMVLTVALLSLTGMGQATVYADGAAFAAETWRCFYKGVAAGTVIGGLLIAAFYRYFPVPGPPWQLAVASVGGVAGVAMLNLHCASDHLGHIVLGHLGQGVFVTLILWAAQRVIFLRLMRHLSGASA